MLRASREAGAVVIEVEDDGPGIAPALLPRIFEPLVTDKPTGTGLGLAFCRTIALVHGGTIEVFRAPSGGALFRFVLPSP
jgi:signal transduction histidine kinase